MSDSNMPFAFSQFVPGFDFLKNLSAGSKAAGGSGAVPGIPSLSSWVAPTLSVEEVDKRIQELKTVQYWLEQNGHALKATIQALEVQKMTLSTLRGMNLRMEDLANSFTRAASTASSMVEPSAGGSSASGTAPGFAFATGTGASNPAADDKAFPASQAPEEDAEGGQADETGEGDKGGEAGGAAKGVVDPLQWWGALTQQFQQIASSALQDASQLKMPDMAQPMVDAVTAMGATGAASASAKKSAASRKGGSRSGPGNPAAKSGAARAPVRKTPAKVPVARKRSRG